MCEKYDYDDLLNDECVTIIPPAANTAYRGEGGRSHPAGGGATLTFYAEIEICSATAVETEEGPTGRRTRRAFARDRIRGFAMKSEERSHGRHRSCDELF